MNLINQTRMGWDLDKKILVGSKEHWANVLKVPSYAIISIIFVIAKITF